MSINGQDLYDSKRSQFNAQGSLTRFDKDYLRAVNAAVDEYNSLLENTATDHLTSVSNNIDLDENQEWIIGHGVDKHILLLGNFKSGDLTYKEAEEDFRVALATALHDRDVAAAAAADTAGDVIGYMGE